MKQFLTIVYKLDVTFQVVAGVGLAFMMAVTVADITMRTLGRPIVGAIELISFSGAVIIGFAVPYSSWMRAHVIVDFLTQRLSSRGRRIMEFITQLVGLVLFLFVGVNFILYGLTLLTTGEVEHRPENPLLPNYLRSRAQLLPRVPHVVRRHVEVGRGDGT